MTSTNAIFGNWVAARRKAAGLSQAALGEKLGLDGSAITRMENDQRKTSLDEAVALSNLLGGWPDLTGDTCFQCGGFPPLGFICQACGAGRWAHE